MRKLALAVTIALTTISYSGICQDPEGPPPHDHKREKFADLTAEEMAKKRTDKMTEKLGLSEEQAEKAYELNLEHAKKMKEIHEERKALHEKMKSERESMKASMDEILTDEQKEQAKSFMEERKEKRQNQRDQPGQCCKHCHKPK